MRGMQSFGRVACTAAVVLLLGACACPPEQPAPMAEPAPAQEPAPAPAPQQPTREEISLSAEALFDFDKATLRPEAIDTLKSTIERYRGNTSLVSVDVVGHTDSVGSDAYNQSLSERRAAAVRDFLVEQGVDGSKISASGKGEAVPVASNDTADGRQKNRRVDISAVLMK